MRFEPNSFAALFSAGYESSPADLSPQMKTASAQISLPMASGRAHSLPEILQALRAGRLLRLSASLDPLYTPASRLVCHPANVKVPGRISRRLRKGEFDLEFDQDFASVWAHRPSFTGLRLLPLIGLRTTLEALAATGHGHYFMLRDAKKRWLASGFGIAVGRAFCLVFIKGHNEDIAKAGLILLARHLAHWGYGLMEASPAGQFARDLGFADIGPSAYQAQCCRQHPPAAPAQWQVLPEIYAAITPRIITVEGLAGDEAANPPLTTKAELFEALDITLPATQKVVTPPKAEASRAA